MDTEAAVLSEQEALAQFRLWTTKLAEAKAAKAELDRLVEGYTRVLEGLNLLYPGLSEQVTVADMKAAQASDVLVVVGMGGYGADGVGHLAVSSSKVNGNGSVPNTSITSENSTRISSTKTVRAILEDLGPDARSTTRDIFAEVQRRCIKLDSDNPLTAVRKALAAGVKKGWINSEDKDKRTKLYWIRTENDADPVNDSGPADEAGPEEASPDDALSQGAVLDSEAAGPLQPVGAVPS